ncbi:MAG: ApaG domain-containing protein [Verrucomicrobia bacterium]|nr:ApaG domain-containing protein [Verrucomicrobiota bacterium]MBU4289515.1 ApaG domain-containing protein [Verrucomicrobiota bacterium]MBU4429496.1 ApaG domain-containing protein [Verrucomicrobiota bacterium]MCG2681488.1 ApaG domain-containing protein [Kiritimatiellia bacterium]
MTDKIVAREAHIHGKLWDKLYDSYFSNPYLARDYVAVIIRAAYKCKPSVIVDLGGGTGFILEQLVAAGIAEDIRLVNMDESDAQLAMGRHPRITPRKGAIQSLRRTEIVKETESLMLICRSVLQYGGIFGQKPWLAHLRDQMKPGEWFVHQSGCSDDLEAALALDVLFEMMNVEKWVPHKEAFQELLTQAKFEVVDDFPMPPVGMPSDGLAIRYGVAPETLAKIKADLRRTCANRPDLFKLTPSGFTFNFPYRVFVCKAVA